MSNSDRCAHDGCGKLRYSLVHAIMIGDGTHAFVAPAPQPEPSDEAAEEFHAHCLNLTVDEARLICECGSGMKTHVFGGHRSCEYFEHHCDSCHERGVCTAHVPVLSKLLALVPVPGAPSGDEAKVRDIARAEAESIATRWVPAHMTARQGMVDDITASLVRYRALGRDDARRGSEGK